MACGTEVLVAGAQVRKTVTILFSDVAGSTALADALDPETVRRVMGRYFDACRSVLQAHGGTVEKFIGDAVMAVFGVAGRPRGRRAPSGSRRARACRERAGRR